jgi:hypothetical protein
MPDGEDERPWHQYYAVLAVASAAFYAGVALGVPGLAAIPEAIAGLIVVAAFAILSVAHYLDRDRLRPIVDELTVEDKS